MRKEFMFKLLNLNNNYRIVEVKEEEQMDGRKEITISYLNELIVYMKKSKEPLIRTWCKTLINWRDEILTHFDNLSSTSMLEVIILIKRISFGIKDINVYTIKVYS